MPQITDKTILDKAAAMADRSELGSYRGRDVIRTKIAIRNAGDGLSEGMAIEPRMFDIDSTVYVLLECTVAKHDYEPIKDTDAMQVEQVFRAGSATSVDPDLARGLIESQAERILEAKEQAAGLLRIEFPGNTPAGDDEDDEAEVLLRQHNVGAHVEINPACPLCVPEPDVEEL